MQKTKKMVIFLSIGIVAVAASMIVMSNVFQNLTPSASGISTINTYGLKSEVIKPDRTGVLCVCPYWIKFSADKLVDIESVEVCRDSNCITQDVKLIIDPSIHGNSTTTDIKNDNVPWTVGDNVDIRLKIIPVHYITDVNYGGVGYDSNPTQYTWIDLGTSKVTNAPPVHHTN